MCSPAIIHSNIISADFSECLSTNISWIKFRENTRCVRVLDASLPECIYEALFKANVKVWRQSVSSYVGRNILLENEKTDCESFLLTSNNMSEVSALFSQNPPLRRFYPFTRIFIVKVVELASEPLWARSDFSFRNNELNTIYENGLEVFFAKGLQNIASRVLAFREITNVLAETLINLTDITSRSLENFYVDYQKHPFLVSGDKKKTFRASFFNCSPNVIHFDGQIDQR